MTTPALDPSTPRLDFEHAPALELRRIDLIASITNQSRFEPIDQPTVDRYTHALNDGAVFPPVTIRRRPGQRPGDPDQLIVLGGNHRVRAHIDAGRKTIEALIVDCDDLTALEISYRDNATHGLPPTDEERITHALILVNDHGRTMAHAARTVGIDPQRITRRVAVRGVEERAARCGVAGELTRVRDSVRPRLASLRDDRVFTKIVRTLVNENIGVQAADALITDVNAQPDVASAFNVVDMHLRQHRLNGGVRSAGRPGESAYARLFTATSTIDGLKSGDVIDTLVGNATDLRTRLRATVRHLMAIDKALADEQRPQLEVVQ